jgi:hypothetical protein
MSNFVFQEDWNLPVKKVYVLKKIVENTLSLAEMSLLQIVGLPLVIILFATANSE